MSCISGAQSAVKDLYLLGWFRHYQALDLGKQLDKLARDLVGFHENEFLFCFFFFALRWPFWKLVPVALGEGMASSHMEKWEMRPTEQL